MGSAREEVEGLEVREMIFLEKRNEIAGLGSGVTGKINDSGWKNVEETLDEVGVTTSTRWIEDNREV